MGQPRAYSRTKNFTTNFGSETDHSALNAELDAAGNSINDIRTNIAILQADDGKLRPGVVTSDSVSAELRASLVAGVTADTVALTAAAQGSADAAAASAAAAAAQANLATSNGTAQVALAAGQVSLATTQATNAAGSATAAANSATAAANSATAAAGSATNAAASVSAAGLPASLVGKALNGLRVNAAQTGYEHRTPAQQLSDIAALPLAGGALTGALTGTSAAFSGALSGLTVTQTSDERKKENWQRLPAGILDALADMELSGLFDWTDGSGAGIGVGAQSLEKLLPVAVHTDAEGNKTVNYGAAALVLCVELARELREVRRGK